MRRFAIIATCVIAILGLTQPAMADSTVAVKGFWLDDSTLNWPGIDSTPCGGTDIVPTFYDSYLGIKSTPLDSANLPASTRSWEIGFNSSPTSSDAYGPQVFPQSASDLQTFQIDVNGSTSGQASIYAWNTGSVWVGKAAVSAPGSGWQTVNAAGLTYTWNDYTLDSHGNPSLSGVTPVTATAAQFEASHGLPADGYIAQIGFGCDNQPFYFQNVKVGAPGSVMTENFSSLADKLSISRSSSKVVAGSGVKIAGGSKFGYVSSVKLQSHPLTSSTWTTIATVPVGARHCGGTTTYACWSPFSKGVYPKVSTAYRWVDPGSVATDPGKSSATTVYVATRISATWPTVYRGRTFGVSGSTYPAKPGAVVTLYGKHGTSVYTLGHATVSRTGTFRVYGAVHLSGTWSFWITVPARTGDVAGKSAVKSEYVH
ncbi:MAG: hypothetical protein ACTHOG_14010 [Marmoricola sp.]